MQCSEIREQGIRLGRKFLRRSPEARRKAVRVPRSAKNDPHNGKLHFTLHFSKNKNLHLKVHFTKKLIDDYRRQIQTLQASLKLVGKTFAAEFIDGSDSRAALPDFHQAVVHILIIKMRKIFYAMYSCIFCFQLGFASSSLPRFEQLRSMRERPNSPYPPGSFQQPSIVSQKYAVGFDRYY